ncbi:MAG TPA: hypothetical protein VGK22_17550 [Candidatus Angelobacter sp.]|jgi:hypothetical protein
MSNRESITVIELFNGDSESGSAQLPLQKLAQITLSDLEAVWGEAEVGDYAWTEPYAERRARSPFPELYEIQSYVAFSYECPYNEVPSLLNDPQKAMKIVRSEAAKRALSVLSSVASSQSSMKRRISFRSKVLFWPPDTEIIP